MTRGDGEIISGALCYTAGGACALNAPRGHGESVDLVGFGRAVGGAGQLAGGLVDGDWVGVDEGDAEGFVDVGADSC